MRMLFAVFLSVIKTFRKTREEYTARRAADVPPRPVVYNSLNEYL